METVALTLDALFHENIWRNEALLSQYERIYNLPRLQYIQHTCSQTISYTQKKNWFIIVVLYTLEGKIYATYDWSTRWLPWWSIKRDEDIQDSIARITKHIHSWIEIRDVQPMSFIDNTFIHKDTAHTLHGIVFTARVQNSNLLEDTQHWGLFPLNSDFIEWVQKYWNKDILTYFQWNILPRIIQSSHQDTQDEEIDTNVKMNYRYKFHRNRWKPILKLFWINNNKNIKKRIIDQCLDAKTIVDVSCWDDNIAQQLGKDKDKLVVVNDISRSQVQLLKIHATNVLCTNHNASHLPFKDKIFDIALCKNTLHHMPHRTHLLSMLYSMKRISKKIILVEIENPENTWWIAKFLHKHWYRWFLNDVWGAYFNNTQFLNLIDYIFWKTHTINQWVFTTWQWRYFWATIEII